MTEKLCLITHQMRDCENLMRPQGNLHHKCRYWITGIFKAGRRFIRIKYCWIQRFNEVLLKGK